MEYTSSEFLAQAVRESSKPTSKFPAKPVPEIGGLGRLELKQGFLEQFVQEILAPVPWGHHVELLKKVKAPRARLYYLKVTA